MEVWKDHPRYVCYLQTSSYGRVRSVDRVITLCNGTLRKIKGKLLLWYTGEAGYLQLKARQNGEATLELAHRCVAETFLPNPLNYPCVNHKDGNKANNHVDNLEWCTHEYNNRHAGENGLFLCGEENKQARLTEQQVSEIYFTHAALSLEILGQMYGVHPTTVWNIRQGYTWNKVTGLPNTRPSRSK